MTLIHLALLPALVAAQYTTTWSYTNLPEHSEPGQEGTNACGSQNSQDSSCQTVVVNNINDFCLWAPPQPNSEIGATEEVEVAYCLNEGHGSRTIPANTLKGVHFVQTPDYLQISGVGDFTSMNVKRNDEGGELDPHGATGLGNPIGGLVFSSAFGNKTQQIHEWTSFMSATEFCFRICDPAGKNPAGYCQHIYDVMGCQWNMPGEYAPGTFDSCKGDSTPPMGVYDGSTFFQGQPRTPEPHIAGSSSSCTTIANLQQTAVPQSARAVSSVMSSSSSSGSASSGIATSSSSARSSGARINAVSTAVAPSSSRSVTISSNGQRVAGSICLLGLAVTSMLLML